MHFNKTYFHWGRAGRVNSNVTDVPTDFFDEIFPDGNVRDLVIRGCSYFDGKDAVFYNHASVRENIGQLVPQMDEFEKKGQSD